jgi:hypothetical protein
MLIMWEAEMSAAVAWVWGYISDLTWWETAAKFAPILTALIALGAAGIAWRAILEQRDIARRRAAIDFFLKTEVDDTAIRLYKKFKKEAPSMTSMPTIPQAWDDYRGFRAFLNICELIAVGIKGGAFSESISYAYWGDVIPESYQTAKQLINCIRNTPGEGSRYTYVELEELAKEWEEKEMIAKAKATKGKAQVAQTKT